MSLEEKNKEKTGLLSQVVFDILATDLRSKSGFHNTFVRRSIANSIYDQAPKLYSGLISIDAKNALQNGLKRSELCKEHPYPRTRTTLDMIQVFDTGFGMKANTDIVMEIGEVLERGCKVHYVLTHENQALYPHQQNYNLTEDEIYSLAGVTLVEDEKVDIIPFIYKFNEIEYKMGIDDLADKLGVSKYRVNKMIKSGEITRRENV